MRPEKLEFMVTGCEDVGRKALQSCRDSTEGMVGLDPGVPKRPATKFATLDNKTTHRGINICGAYVAPKGPQNRFHFEMLEIRMIYEA